MHKQLLHSKYAAHPSSTFIEVASAYSRVYIGCIAHRCAENRNQLSLSQVASHCSGRFDDYSRENQWCSKCQTFRLHIICQLSCNVKAALQTVGLECNGQLSCNLAARLPHSQLVSHASPANFKVSAEVHTFQPCRHFAVRLQSLASTAAQCDLLCSSVQTMSVQLQSAS